MNSKLCKILSSVVLSALVLTAMPIASNSVYAENSVYKNNNYYSGKEIHVIDSNSFAVAVCNASHGDVIMIDRDITLDRTIKINSSVTIDLCDHRINLANNAHIEVGEKVFSHVQYYNVDHPGYYSSERKVTYVSNPDVAVYDAFGRFLYYERVPDTEVVTYENVWHPGWTETKSRDIYNYLDHLDIVIEYGDIVGASGYNGADGTENTFGNCSGRNGGDGKNAITVVSGTLRLRNVSVTGGSGGNGGDGKYQAILHVPFFTGNGGNGGNGGDAGHAVILSRKGANLVQEKGVILKPGNCGNGGKGGPANPNHWVGKGSPGKRGMSGHNVSAIRKDF